MTRYLLSSLVAICVSLGSLITSEAFSIPSSVANHPTRSNDDNSRRQTRLHMNFVDSGITSLTQQVAVDPSNFSFLGLTELIGPSNAPLAMAGAAVSVLAIALSAVISSVSSKQDDVEINEVPEPEPEPIDVSIPYDATVILAYKEWKQEEPDLTSDCFLQFKKLYLEKTVAEVTLKQKARKFEQLLAAP